MVGGARENQPEVGQTQRRKRINEGRFFVACVGQFKRGKSTLLDALVGEQILPTGVVPVTTVPTVLRYGSRRTARVLIDSKWRTIRPEELSQYVSEELNPENKKRVEGVEAFLPSPLLASGMCLVDTPGIGSVFAGNTETTKDFIPQIDAAILVVGADPPISGEELALIEAVAVNVDQVLIVLNKIDRVSSAERQQASAFATKVLEARLKKPVGLVYEVSALSKLNNFANADDWNTLTEDLGRLASKSGQAMTRSAAERGMRRFSASLQRSLDERVRALKEPIANSEQRIANLRQAVSQAEQSLRDLGALFSAEQMSGVQVCERWIVAALRNRKFFSLPELNQAIRELLVRLNKRPFRKRDGSRSSLFHSLEKPALAALPAEHFDMSQWSRATINIDYHIAFDGNFYNVPYTLVQQVVEVRSTPTTVEIFHKGNRIASHLRGRGRGRAITQNEHRPKSHQAHLEWPPSRMVNWARSIGPNTAQLFERILNEKPHPEMGYRSCLGIIRLAQQYSRQRMEAAAERALLAQACRYQRVKSILKNSLDAVPLPPTQPGSPPLTHDNVRGADYFDQGRPTSC